MADSHARLRAQARVIARHITEVKMATKKPAKKLSVKDLKPVKGAKVLGGRKAGEGQKD